MRQPKHGVEKYLLRRAFDGTNLLPTDILWRPKEAFSDGVSPLKRSWYCYLQDYAAKQVHMWVYGLLPMNSFCMKLS